MFFKELVAYKRLIHTLNNVLLFEGKHRNFAQRVQSSEPLWFFLRYMSTCECCGTHVFQLHRSKEACLLRLPAGCTTSLLRGSSD